MWISVVDHNMMCLYEVQRSLFSLLLAAEACPSAAVMEGSPPKTSRMHTRLQSTLRSVSHLAKHLFHSDSWSKS